MSATGVHSFGVARDDRGRSADGRAPAFFRTPAPPDLEFLVIRSTARSLTAAALTATLMLAGCGANDAEPAGTSSAVSSAPTSSTPTSSAGASSVPTSSVTATGAASSSAALPSPDTSAVSSTADTSSAVSSVPTSSALDANGCITDFDAATDYFPDKQTLKYATTFAIEYRKSFQVVTVTPPGGTSETYVLLRCGAPKPALTGDLANAQVVTTPVHSLYSASTTHLPSLVALDRLDVLTGVSSSAFVSEPEVLAHLEKKKVAEFAPTGAIDAEAVITGKPEVLIGGGFPDPADPKIEAAGVPVLQDVDAVEPLPLGQAEWIKFFAALTGTEATATTVFGGIAADYQKTAALVGGADAVQIVPNQPYQGEWYVPGGKSAKATLLADAGGTTAFADDTSSGSVKTTFEKVFANSAKAPVWLATATWTSEKTALTEDPRFARFTAFKDHNVWNPVKGVTKAGGNPYYELGALRVDLVLADLVAILHPDLLPDHAFTFYLKLK